MATIDAPASRSARPVVGAPRPCVTTVRRHGVAPTTPAPAAGTSIAPGDPRRTLRPGTDDVTEAVGRRLGLPLHTFAAAGQRLEIRVPWDSEPLWFVPTPEDAKTVTAEGVNPGRIWTASALRQLLAAGITREGTRRIAQARMAFEADEVVITRPTLAAPSPAHEQLTLEDV